MEGSAGPPLVLLHGLGMSGRIWDNVVPQLSAHYTVFAPTTVGHWGGPTAERRPATAGHQVDWVESYLDEQSIARAHLAGNSMGGFVALQLARRGRALSVSAFAPGGFWAGNDELVAEAAGRIRRAVTMTRLSRPIAPLLLKSATVRRRAMRDVAAHGDRLTPAEAVRIADEMLGCTVVDDVLSSARDSEVAPLVPLPCPITIAWSEHDTVIPVGTHRVARQRMPSASFVTLGGCGHVPMADDPEQVARIILETSDAASQDR